MRAASLFASLAVLCHAVPNPKPNPDSVVQIGKARFTVLTENLVRMEWGGMVDAATFTFINRNLPTPKYTLSNDTDPQGNVWNVIKTSAVKVTYLQQIF